MNNRSVLGGIIFFCLILSAALVFTIFAGRMSTDHRLRLYTDAMGTMSDRMEALEKQRTLLEESASALEAEAQALRKRSNQIGVEIGSMRQILSGADEEARAPFFSLRGFHLSTASALIVIAFLLFIWMLYTAVKKPGDGLEEDEDAGERPPVPGSVREEEFSAAPAAGAGPAAVTAEESASSAAGEEASPPEEEEEAETERQPS